MSEKSVKKRRKRKEKKERKNQHPEISIDIQQINHGESERKKAKFARATREVVPNAISIIPKYHRLHPPHFPKPIGRAALVKRKRENS